MPSGIQIAAEAALTDMAMYDAKRAGLVYGCKAVLQILISELLVLASFVNQFSSENKPKFDLHIICQCHSKCDIGKLVID
jgi:hypothetical protein